MESLTNVLVPERGIRMNRHIVFVLVVSMLLVLFEQVQHAYGTPTSQTVSPVGSLDVSISSEKDAKVKVMQSKDSIIKQLALPTNEFVVSYLDSDSADLFTGTVKKKAMKLGDLDFLWEYMTVERHNSDKVTGLPSGRTVYSVRVPVIPSGGKCLVKDGKVLVKLAPQFASISGKETEKKTQVFDRFEIRYSEVMAEQFMFLLDEKGTIYR